MTALAIITARGGSKRIPGKNIKAFCGKPIIAYSIEAARASGLFDEVMVSTDDPAIKDVSEKYGASVPFLRSQKNSDDHATTADVILEVLEEYRAQGKCYDIACCLYPTAPFVTPEKLREAHAMLCGIKEVHTVFVATSFSYPPQRGLVEESGMAKWWLPQYSQSRSQDLTNVYHDAGQFYFFHAQSFLESRTLIGDYSKMLLVPETEVQDVDNPVDWELAEMKYERMVARNEQA